MNKIPAVPALQPLPVVHVCLACRPGVREVPNAIASHGYCRLHALVEVEKINMLSPLEALELGCRRKVGAWAHGPFVSAEALAATLRRLSRLVGLLLVVGLSGCATIIDGRTQAIVFETDPQGADCVVRHNGDLAAHFVTPATVTLQRRDGYDVECAAAGRETVRGGMVARGNPWVPLNFLNGAWLGVIVDNISGAQNVLPSFWKTVLPRAAGGR